MLCYLHKQIQWETIDAVDLKKSLKWGERFTTRYGKREKTLMYDYVEAVVLISPVLWASGAQTISEMRPTAAFIKADPMLVSPPEK